jgi:ubiquinone/menaquinone biosynthesis C-methylase UbiE
MGAQEKSGFSARFHAWLMSHAGPRYDRLVRERKADLFVGLRGNILEIGPGTGPNLSYFPAGVHWLGIEPNACMNPYLSRAMAQADAAATVRQGIAERLPVEDQSQDAVVSTLVLCSVSQPELVLREVRRVLRPGGQFLFMEHVAAERGTGLRTMQQWVQPLWGRLADGCHVNRETGKLIEAAGFLEVHIERFRLPLGLIAPQIAGRAIR